MSPVVHSAIPVPMRSHGTRSAREAMPRASVSAVAMTSAALYTPSVRKSVRPAPPNGTAAWTAKTARSAAVAARSHRTACVDGAAMCIDHRLRAYRLKLSVQSLGLLAKESPRTADEPRDDGFRLR